DGRGGGGPGSNGLFVCWGQAGICPIAGEHEVVPGRAQAGPTRILLGRRGEGRTPLAHDLPWRQFGGKAGDARDLAPDSLRERLARRVEEPVAGADGGRDATREGEDPLGRRIDHAEDRRQALGRLDAKVCIDDGAELGRGLETRKERGGRVRWYRKDNGVLGGEVDAVLAKVERRYRRAGKAHGVQLMPEQDRAPSLREQRERGLDQGRAEALARDQRPASLATGRHGLADDRARKRRRADGGID